MFPYLTNHRVNLQLLQETACRELLTIFDTCDGSKAIAFDGSLMGPVGLIANARLFSDRNIKLLRLEPETRYPRDVKNIIFIVRPSITLMDVICNHLNRESTMGAAFHLYFVPRKSCLCLTHLENKDAITKLATVDEIPWNFYPLDKDIVSMEWPLAFKETAVEGNTSVLYQAAQGLVQLQKIYGRIPKIYGKGRFAQQVWELAKVMGTEDKIMYNAEKGAIDQIILLDRSVDFVSVFATQLTYEGLIDEVYGIRQNQVSLPSDMFQAGSDGASQANLVSEQKVQMLNSGEKLYPELRDKNFNEVGSILARNAREVSTQMSETNTQDKSVQDIKQFVLHKLPELMALKASVELHTKIAESIRRHVDTFEFSDDLAAEQEFMLCEDLDKPSSYIEDLIAKKSELRTVLRFICMQCAAASGFKEKVLNYYKRELVQVYGIEVLLTISNLEKAELLRTQSEARAYAVLRKTLNLTVEDHLEINPKDISYVHSFYAPLTVRIVEQTLKPLGWQSLKGQINNLPGPSFEDFQAQLVGIGGRHSSTPSEGSLLNIPRVLMIFFVGGCTFAEIAALRFLAQQEDNNVEFVIATTKIINKNTFLDSLICNA